MGCQQAKPKGPDPTAPAPANSPPCYAKQFAVESDGPFFRSRPEVPRPLALPENPDSAFTRATLPPETVIAEFKLAVSLHGSKPALKVERPVPQMDAVGNAPASLPDSEWKTWTWQEYYDDSFALAKSLLTCGLQRFEGVIVFGFNSPEWHISQMGITMAGGLTAGIYPTDSPDILAYKAVHCRARVAIVEDSAKLRKLEEVLEHIPRLTHIVMYSPSFNTPKTITRRQSVEIKVISWLDFLQLGSDLASERVNAAIQAQQANECFSLFYTSGISGFPRGVMLSHDNVIVSIRSAFHALPALAPGSQERILSYLPLSHSAVVLFDMIAPLVGTAHRTGNYFTTYFARPYDLKSNRLTDRLQLVRPTMFFAVPRVYEKLMDRLLVEEGNLGRGGRWSLKTAKRTGLEHYQGAQVHRGDNKPVPSNALLRAKEGVFAPLRQSIGLDHARAVFTGGAPTQPHVLEYFASVGFWLLDTYALSETSGAVLASLYNKFRFNSCGAALLANEVCVMRRAGGSGNGQGEGEVCPPCQNLDQPTEEEQGELCFRGRTIMLGYLTCPESCDEQRILAKNREAIDAQGWLHSGDKGCVDEFGMFRVTGRFKEVIISAAGTSIAPLPIEDSIKRLSKGVVSNVLMVGDKRKFNVALITLNCTNTTSGVLNGPAAWLVPGVQTVNQVCTSPEYIRHLEKAVNDTNFDGMVCPSRACQVRKFTILPHDFSEEEGDFSTSHKLRRSKMEARHANAINAMFSSTSTNSMYVPYET
ncbi:hypothetical protein BASA81_002422 [Batrachochytrium salamandrivorans]|nr:hypothetical protein BASA81_002422 [Batrachochytrium salamandrivorans]